MKRGRTRTNLVVNVGNFAFNLLVGFWFTPYLIHRLGTGSYGLIPLVNQITGYMAIASVLSNTVVGRYVTIALQQDDTEEANRYFNAAFFGNLIIVGLLAIPACLLAWNIEHLIRVPAGQEVQARWLFICSIICFFLTLTRSVFNVATYSTNRLALQTTVNALANVARVVLVVLFFSFWRPELWHVSLATLLSGFAGWGWTIRLWRRLTPMLRVSWSQFQFTAARSLISTGGWLGLNQVGALLFLAIDLIVVNRLFGSEAGGRYAAVLHWSVLLRGVATLLGGVFAPTITYLYARKQMSELVAFSRQAMTFVGLAIGLPIALISGLSAPLLKVWLGPEFADLSWLMSLQTFHLSVNLAMLPLLTILTATNHVKLPAIATAGMGLVNLGLALFLAGPMHWGLYGVAAAGAMAWTLKNLLFTSIYAALVIGCPWTTFLKTLVSNLYLSAGTAGLGLLLVWWWHPPGWAGLAGAAFLLAAVYSVIAYRFVLSAKERAIVLQFAGRLKFPISPNPK